MPTEVRTRVVALLADRPQDMTGTARYAVRTYGVDNSSNDKLVTSLEGQADFDHQRYSATVDLYRLDDGSLAASLEYFVLGNEIHEHVPVGWRRGTKPPGEIGSPLAQPPLLGYFHDGGGPAYANDRAARRTLVDGLVSTIELTGSQRLRGEDADRYRVYLDENRARSMVEGSLIDEMNRWGESPGKGTLDVWISGDRLRQFTSVDKSYGQKFVRFEQEYWDYGGVEALGIPPGIRP
ncbi:MAG: hypothetical protein ACRD12_06975 [Acidimicrobiales bacterium]